MSLNTELGEKACITDSHESVLANTLHIDILGAREPN